MVQWWKALAALPQGTGSIGSTHMAAHNHLTLVPGDLIPSSDIHGHSMQTPTDKKQNFLYKIIQAKEISHFRDKRYN